MQRISLASAIGIGFGVFVMGGQVQALPGQTSNEASLWIQNNSTLRPTPGEKLLIRRSDTPAQRFRFQASLLQVGRATPGPNGGVIRTEELSLFDMINGITRDRLEESLRAVYGSTVYQDYARARVVYAYPQAPQLDEAVNAKTPVLAALQGEVREGDQYAYWLEIARRPNGFAYTGRVTVFLRTDLPKLEAELRTR